jgi:NTE family protein
MFGAYQVGAWKVLSRTFVPDLVVGVSIGSLNAWMVAGGCSAADLEQHWMDGEAHARYRWRAPRRLAEGFADPTAAYAVMQRMHRELKPKLSLGIVARRLPTLRPVVFQNEQITWRHLAASCAIPFVFDLQALSGVTYADGGLLDPLPLFAAAQMGASEILGINCMTWGGFGRGRLNARCMRPSRRLGLTPQSVLCWNRDRTKRWIAQGEEDALRFSSRDHR